MYNYDKSFRFPSDGGFSLEPEQIARQQIDNQLRAAGWIIQDRSELNLHTSIGVAVREFPVTKPNGNPGEADYMLFINQKAVGVIEAKRQGTTLSGIAEQSSNYAAGLADNIPHEGEETLPFLYQSTGIETTFRDERDPEPRSRAIFHFHQPKTLAQWLSQPNTLRSRLRQMPPLAKDQLWLPQIEAIENLEISFSQDKPRALIQMATGSGKTFTAVNFTYRLIKFAKAKRVLFLVDRNNLGKQAFGEFDNFSTPDDGRKFTELYNVQQLQSNILDDVSKVHITTIQRLFSMLKGDPEFDPENEERSLFEMGSSLDHEQPRYVTYSTNIPIDYYDFIIIDECHRSIYNLWRDVLLYFDAYLIGLTATPSALTFGFFNRNLVMEYNRQRAVADGVNVDGEVYRIRTKITEQGSQIDAGFGVYKRDKLTRQQRWELLDENLEYDPKQLDREVVAEGQIRTIVRAFRERLFTEIFPGRSEVPKTLIFAKDDAHAENIVSIVREEFGRGDEFCKKITYKVSGTTPGQLIRDFRSSYYPRIVVTVDMIATGTDIKPLEILLFMRSVKSRGLFEQMLGRGTRVISDTDYRNVVPDNAHKTHFVIVDAVGVIEREKFDPQVLERKKSKTFSQLMESIALGAFDEDDLFSLAGRLSRLIKKSSETDLKRVEECAGETLQFLINQIINSTDIDHIREKAQVENFSEMEAAEALTHTAVYPFASNPQLRQLLENIKMRSEQVIDVTSQDTVLEAGFNAEATEKAKQLVGSFQLFLEENKDQITALELIFQQPTSQQHLTFIQIKELAKEMTQPPNAFTTEQLWRAYAQLEKDRVRGVNEKRVLTDLVTLVRHALMLDDELTPYPDVVTQRYHQWLEDHERSGKAFTAQQRWWLDRITEHIGVNLEINITDLDSGIFLQRGGRLGAIRIFSDALPTLLDEINQNVRYD